MDKTIRTRHFEFSKVRWNWWSIMFGTGDDNARGGNSITLIGFGRFLHIRLPFQLVPPHRTRVTAGWDAETIARIGRDWYWNVVRREFGITLFGNHFTVRYGRQTDCWPGERSWGFFLPWSEWRMVRHSLYRLDGTGFWHGSGNVPFDKLQLACDVVPMRRKAA